MELAFHVTDFGVDSRIDTCLLTDAVSGSVPSGPQMNVMRKSGLRGMMPDLVAHGGSGHEA